MLSDATMKVSLTPDRLKTMDVRLSPFSLELAAQLGLYSSSSRSVTSDRAPRLSQITTLYLCLVLPANPTHCVPWT